MRRLPPLLILLAGVGLFIYGAFFNRLEVRVENPPPQTPAPTPQGLPGTAAWPQLPGLPDLPELGEPVDSGAGEERPPETASFEVVAMAEGEALQEITVGGLERDEKGKATKPYRTGPDSACPT